MANTSLVKKSNMFDIIKIVKNNDSITKPEIVRMTGLTSGTVHNIINELIEKEIIVEQGIADSNGGRKAILYGFNSSIYYIVGVFIGVKHTSAGIFDLNLNIVDRFESKYELAKVSVEEGIKFVAELIENMIKKSKIDKRRIMGLGITVPGPVNYDKGLIYELTNIPKWRNIPLKSIIEKELGIMTIIDKDNNGNVLSLKWMDKNREKKNVVYLSTFEGIGTGILINGSVYRGNHCVAGEIGHISVDINGETCNCGNRGCIELNASNLSIVNKVKKLIKSGADSLIMDLCDGQIDGISMDMIVHAAKRHDSFAKEVLLDASRYISICIGNVINTYDPDEIILHCTWLKELNDIYFGVMNNVYESTKLIRRDDVIVTLNSIKDLHLIGAVTLIMDYQLKSYENCMLIS